MPRIDWIFFSKTTVLHTTAPYCLSLSDAFLGFRRKLEQFSTKAQSRRSLIESYREAIGDNRRFHCLEQNVKPRPKYKRKIYEDQNYRRGTNKWRNSAKLDASKTRNFAKSYSRDQKKLEKLAKSLNAQSGTPAQQAGFGEAVMLAVP